jgi:hypothetical protein
MERTKTRRATRMFQFVIGVILALAGLFLFIAFKETGKFAFVLVFFGAVAAAMSRGGHACADCGKVLKKTEFYYEQKMANEIRLALMNKNVDELADIFWAPQLTKNANSYAAVVFNYCAKCKRVATVMGVENNNGSRILGETEISGADAETLVESYQSLKKET